MSKNQVLQQLSDDERAAEGSDDDLGMDEDYSYDSASRSIQDLGCLPNNISLGSCGLR